MTPRQEALISAYLLGTKARTHEEMIASVRLARQLEHGLTHQELAECKLKADADYESSRQNPVRYLSDRG